VRRSAAALVVAVLLAACGGGGTGKALSQAQLIAKVDAECRRLQRASADLVNAQDLSAHGARVARYLHAAASQLRGRAQAIDALVPPASRAGEIHRFAALLGRYADQLDALADRTRSGEVYNDLLARSTSQVNALNHLSDQANGIAAALGFTGCAT
jgi:hypothetical protein